MKMLLISLPVLAISTAACGQPLPAQNVPSVVQNALKVRFSDATALEWEKAGDTYQVEFKQGTEEYEVRLNPTGQVLSVKQDIALTDLPAAISNAIAGQFKGYKIDDAERLENDGKVYYQVELEKLFSEKKMVYTTEGQLAANVTYWD